MTQYKSSAYGGAYQYGDMDKEEAGMPQYREPEMLGMDHSAKLERSMRLAFIRKVSHMTCEESTRESQHSWLMT